MVDLTKEEVFFDKISAEGNICVGFGKCNETAYCEECRSIQAANFTVPTRVQVHGKFAVACKQCRSSVEYCAECNTMPLHKK